MKNYSYITFQVFIVAVLLAVIGCAADGGVEQYDVPPGGGAGAGSGGEGGGGGLGPDAGPGPLPGDDAYVPPAPVDSGYDSAAQDEFRQVDIVILVDNSGSMEEEQRILSTQFFNLVNALVDSPAPSDCPIDNVRIAVVTSDMGLQSGDNNDLPNPSPLGTVCPGQGDDAQFKTYGGGHAIDIQPGVINCNQTATQCPANWTCDIGSRDAVGDCIPPGGGNGAGQACPAMNGSWVESKVSDKNPNLAFQTSCLAKQGTQGCGFEQQIKALVRAPSTLPDFLRDDAMLALIVVSDEEDCSIQDVALFDAPEFATENVNLVCGRNEGNLYTTASYRDQILALKGGDEEKVIFAGIVGVPLGSECEGLGSNIPGCLNHARMALSEVPETSLTTGATGNYYAPACERFVPSNSTDPVNQVTKARPGRRYVEMAQQFAGRGYISSICNEDWEAVMDRIAKLIGGCLLE